MMRRSPFARHRFPPEIIRHAVWLYLRPADQRRLGINNDTGLRPTKSEGEKLRS